LGCETSFNRIQRILYCWSRNGPRRHFESQSAADAYAKIAAAKAKLYSRGDNSGTHKKELSLWKAADQPVPEKVCWYVQTGQGMLATINIAAERKGYTMTDRGTYIKYEDNLKGDVPLKILVAGDAVLLNQYSVIAISKKHCSNAKSDTANQFIEWITGPDAQKMIKEFKLLGKPLFTPNAKM
jgi:tungstate transport system substrate-binding protein